MRVDLAQAGADPEALARRLRSQVCIVGGGIAGLILAHRLLVSGVTVTLLEAGGLEQAPGASEDPFGAELQGQPHAGTREGRVCALGGCSVTWGGQLLPLPDDAAWPVPVAEIRRRERNWRMPYDAAAFFAAHGAAMPTLPGAVGGLTPRLSRFVPFRRRNLARTLGKTLLRARPVRVVLHAGVTELVLSAAGDRVAAVQVRTPAGAGLQVQAEQFVLAAGTVQTCRLLLASRSVAREGVGNQFGQVGLHFHDHLTMPAATFTGAARERVLRELRPWVFAERRQSAALYSMKLEASAALRAELGLNAAMAHVTMEEPEESGVGVLRGALRARQQGGGAGSVGRALPRVLGQAVRLAWEARVQHRRYVSPEAAVRLQLNVAQEVPSASRVRLSEGVDRFGMPRAVVDWRISQTELATFRRFATYLRERLAAAGLNQGVVWREALFAEGAGRDEALLAELDDARHAMGGARMGTDPRSSVVDPELRVHGVGNLSVASAAVFPDGSAQLPTLTLSALCLRLAERLKAELG